MATTLTTTQRGYGWAHQQARTAALRRLRDGDPCARCHHPMYRRDAPALDLDHDDTRTAYRGLAHARCNRQAGQRVGAQRRRISRTRARSTRARSTRSTTRAVNSRAW